MDSRAMRTIQGNSLVELAVIGNNHASLTQRRHILLLVETEAAGDSHRPSLAVFVLAADGLASILPQTGISVLAGNFEDRIHLAALTIEMDRDNCLGMWCDCLGELARVEIYTCADQCRRKSISAPSVAGAAAVAIQVIGVVITRSPGFDSESNHREKQCRRPVS